MPKKSKKMRIAVCILLAVILVSTYASARRGLSETLDAVEAAFIEGTDGSGYSIYTDLQNRAALARNLKTVALRYLDEDAACIRDLDAAANRLEGERDPERAYSANAALDEAAAAVSAQLEALELSDTDENYRIGIMTDLESYNATIAHDGYNEYVREVNEKTLSRFPANIFRIITFTANAKYYR